LKVLKMLRLFFVVHVDPVVKHDQGAAAEQVRDVAGKHPVYSLALQPLERLLVNWRVNVIEALDVVRSADEEADGAVARLELAAGGLARRSRRQTSLMSGPVNRLRCRSCKI
jgi:hypothetical protein